MGKAISLVVGVSKPTYGSFGYLHAVELDCRAMEAFLSARGLERVDRIMNSNATAGNVLSAIRSAARKLESGDSFAFYYSGHGTRSSGAGGDEARDQKLVTYDEPIVDDQLGVIWPEFKSGVRVLVITDSCNSGTVLRELRQERDLVPMVPTLGLLPRNGMSRDVIIPGLRCSIVHFAACSDDQDAQALVNGNSIFTRDLLNAWNRGFNRSYKQWFEQTRVLVSQQQTNWTGQRNSRVAQAAQKNVCGPGGEAFWQQEPFDLSVAGSGTVPPVIFS